MKVTFYGHNCFVLKGKRVVVVTDPWLSDKGAFFGSWFQWPINHHLKDQLKGELNTEKKSILYISHEHQDHFDMETLRDIKSHIDICIIPNYEDKFLYNKLLEIDFKVIELTDQYKYFVTETDYIELMVIDTGVNHDSASLIHIDNKNFLNQNDCKIFDRLTYFKDIEIDYYAVQFSGATWHPMCYRLDENKKTEISRKKIASKLAAIRNAINLIKPKFYLPSAGPAIFPFLEHSLSLGSGNVFVHQPELRKFLKSSATELLYIKPGDELDNLKNVMPIEPPKASDLEAMRENLDCIFEHIKDEEFNPEKLIEVVVRRLNKIKDIKFGDCPTILFDWGEKLLEIDLKKATAEIIDPLSYKYPGSYLKVVASKAYFSLMSNQEYRWQDIALSFRVSVERKPDILNTFANIFLFSDECNIRSGFITTLDIKEERILIVNPVDGKNYEIDRYCPHNGADLKDARVDNQGNLICPRHSWLFDLQNDGRCTSAAASLHAKEVVKTISLCESHSARLLKIDE